MSDKVEKYVLIVEFQALPMPASLFRNMVENSVDSLIATNGLKVKGPIELQSASDFVVAQNSTSNNTAIRKLLCEIFDYLGSGIENRTSDRRLKDDINIILAQLPE